MYIDIYIYICIYIYIHGYIYIYIYIYICKYRGVGAARSQGMRTGVKSEDQWARARMYKLILNIMDVRAGKKNCLRVVVRTAIWLRRQQSEKNEMGFSCIKKSEVFI